MNIAHTLAPKIVAHVTFNDLLMGLVESTNDIVSDDPQSFSWANHVRILDSISSRNESVISEALKDGMMPLMLPEIMGHLDCSPQDTIVDVYIHKDLNQSHVMLVQDCGY